MTGIAEMFQEFDGYDRYELALAQWAPVADARKRAMNAEYVARWRKTHRAEHRMSTRRWRAKRSPDLCTYCTAPRVPGRKACQPHLESDRAKAKARYAARIARAA